jgi:hypothetical protein
LIGIVSVFDANGDRRPCRDISLNASQKLDMVVLDTLPAASAVPPLPAPEVVVDPVDVERQPGRHSLEDSGQGGAV